MYDAFNAGEFPRTFEGVKKFETQLLSEKDEKKAEMKIMLSWREMKIMWSWQKMKGECCQKKFTSIDIPF